MVPVGNTERGLIAAFFGVFGFGAFGVPLKGEGMCDYELKTMNKMTTNNTI